MADKQDEVTPKALFNQAVTSSAGSTLTEAKLQEAWDAMPKGGITEIVLVAPNKRIQAQWRKDYPGAKVWLAQRLPETKASTAAQENANEQGGEL